MSHEQTPPPAPEAEVVFHVGPDPDPGTLQGIVEEAADIVAHGGVETDLKMSVQPTLPESVLEAQERERLLKEVLDTQIPALLEPIKHQIHMNPKSIVDRLWYAGAEDVRTLLAMGKQLARDVSQIGAGSIEALELAMAERLQGTGMAWKERTSMRDIVELYDNPGEVPVCVLGAGPERNQMMPDIWRIKDMTVAQFAEASDEKLLASVEGFKDPEKNALLAVMRSKQAYARKFVQDFMAEAARKQRGPRG